MATSSEELTGLEPTVTISELAKLVDRRPATIRAWEYNNILPEHLMPSRNDRGWRVWTLAQVDGIKRWLQGVYPGSGLPGYHPTAAQKKDHIARIGPKARRGAPGSVRTVAA